MNAQWETGITGQARSARTRLCVAWARATSRMIGSGIAMCVIVHPFRGIAAESDQAPWRDYLSRMNRCMAGDGPYSAQKTSQPR